MYFIPKSLKQRALKIPLATIELSVNGKKAKSSMERKNLAPLILSTFTMFKVAVKHRELNYISQL